MNSRRNAAKEEFAAKGDAYKEPEMGRVLDAASHHSLGRDRDQEVLQLRGGSSQRGGTKTQGQGIERPIKRSISMDDQCLEVACKLKKKFRKVFTVGENLYRILGPRVQTFINAIKILSMGTKD